MRWIIIFLLTACVAAGFAQPILWSQDGVPVRTGARVLWDGQMVVGPTGRVLTTWSDAHDGDRSVYAEGIAFDMGPYWSETGVCITPFPGIQSGAGACLSGYGWIIGWIDYRNTSFSDLSGDVYAQRTGEGAGFYWNPNGILVSENNNGIVHESLVVRSDRQNGAYFIWREYVPSGDGHAIFCRRIDYYGNLQWTEPLRLPTLGRYVFDSDVTSDDAGSLFIAWNVNADDNMDLYLTKITPDGAQPFPGGSVLITVPAYSMRYPQIAPDGAGGCYVIWQDNRNYPAENIYAQHVDSAGQLLWGSEGVALWNRDTTAILFDAIPSINNTSLDGVVVAWYDHPGTRASRVYAQKLDPQGHEFWRPGGLPISTDTVNSPYDISLATDSLGGAIAVWNRSGPDYEMSTFVNRILVNGSLPWNNEVEVTPDDPQRRGCTVIADRTGRALVSWLGFDDEGQTLRVQRIQLSDGTSEWEDYVTSFAQGLEGIPYRPRAVPMSNMKTGVVWLDHRSWFGPTSLYFQIIYPSGEIYDEANGERLVPGNSEFDNANQSEANMCPDGQGGFFAVFTSPRNNLPRVRLAHVNEHGSRPYGYNGITVWNPSPYSQGSPRCIKDGLGGCYVAWGESSVQSSAVCLIRYTGAGIRAWAEPDLFDIAGVPWDSGPRLAADSAGNCLLLWQAGDFADYSLHAAKIRPDGNVLWNTVAASGIHSIVDFWIADDRSGGAYAVWCDQLDDENSDLYAQHLGNTGQAQWNPAEVAASEWAETCGGIAVDRLGRLIVLESANLNHLDFRLAVHKLAANAAPVWGDNGVILCADPGRPGSAEMTLDSKDRVFVVWEDARQPNQGLYGAHIDSAGQWTVNPYWQPGVGGAIYRHDNIPPTGIALAPDSLGFAVIWQDGRDEPFSAWTQLFAQRVRGVPLSHASEPSRSAPREFALDQNYPNPFNPVTQIRFELPALAPVNVSVFDVSGRLVAVLTDGTLSPGRYTLSWDGSSCASGLYFCRMQSGAFEQTRKMLLLK